MSTKRQLVARWKAADGEPRAKSILAALRKRDAAIGYRDLPDHIDDGILAELRELTAGFVFSSEVAPAIDLRGMPFDDMSWFRCLDLSDVRFDYSRLPGGIGRCRLVGAVFDGCNADNRSFGGDFTGASFASAVLKGAAFDQSILDRANLRAASLVSASFLDASCRNAGFQQASLRFATFARADLRGADLTDADLSDATMGSVVFDSSTVVARANLSHASMDKEFLRYCRSNGAILDSTGPSPRDLAVLDAIVEKASDHPVAYRQVNSYVSALRDNLVRNPSFNWLEELERHSPVDIRETLAELWVEVMKDPSTFS